MWGGVQLAVDTTLVSALDASSRPRQHQGRTLGAALRIARLAKERAYPELMRAQRCRLVVVAIEVAGRWSSEAVEFVRLLARSRARSAPAHLRASHSGGPAFSLSRPPVPSRPRSSLLPCMAQPTSMARSQPSAISSPKSATGQTALSPAASLRGGEGPPARPAGRVSWTFPTPCGQPAVSFGLGLRTGTAWIGFKKVRQQQKKHILAQTVRRKKKSEREREKKKKKHTHTHTRAQTTQKARQQNNRQRYLANLLCLWLALPAHSALLRPHMQQV